VRYVLCQQASGKRRVVDLLYEADANAGAQVVLEENTNGPARFVSHGSGSSSGSGRANTHSSPRGWEWDDGRFWDEMAEMAPHMFE